MATTAEREAKEQERQARMRDLLPGTAIPSWIDEEIVEKEQEALKDRTELLLRDPGNPTGPPMLNPNHPLGKALEGTVSNGSRLEALLVLLVAKQAGFDIGVEEPMAKEKQRPEEATGSVAGGAPEGQVSSTPTTGPSATGGRAIPAREAADAEAAAGVTDEQRRRDEEQRREAQRKR
jgi:hypothetical protein